jgi:Ran GTPase-activating protein (RanGAP) involved in mRNA processing and transport
MGGMSSLHVGQNSIPEKEMREIMVIAMRMDSMKVLCEVPFKDKTLSELDVSGKNLGMEGALVVTEYLCDNGALTSLNLSLNRIGKYHTGNTEGAQALSTALKGSNVIKDLNLSANGFTADDVQLLAGAISDMGAQSLLNLTDNCIGKARVQKIKEICGSRNISLLIN